MATLERAIAIAAEAHAGQTDKAGAPYILHPLRVMMAMPDDLSYRIVAVLHDVLEDCPAWTADRLDEEGFSVRTVAAILSVTRCPGEAYTAAIARANADPIGRVVKLADLRDNMDLSRISSPTDRDWERYWKYRRAVDLLEGRHLTPSPLPQQP